MSAGLVTVPHRILSSHTVLRFDVRGVLYVIDIRNLKDDDFFCTRLTFCLCFLFSTFYKKVVIPGTFSHRRNIRRR